MSKSQVTKGTVVLRRHEVEVLQQRLNIIPDHVNGMPLQTKVRRGAIERRRLSLVKADKLAPNLLASQELYRLCQYINDGFKTVGWAIRSTVSGDYFVYSEKW